MIIRNALPDDAPSLLQLAHDARQEDETRFGPGTSPLVTLQDIQQNFGFSRAPIQPASGLIAELDHTITGVIQYSWLWRNYRPAIYIDDLFVKAAYRNRGIGRQLLQSALGKARQDSASCAYIMVDIHNDGARKLYLREGARMVEQSEENHTLRWEFPL